jgi:DNA-binding NarL/FixJ family response regulator
VPDVPDVLRVLVADDNAVVRAGLVSLLRLDDGLEVVGEARDGQEAVRLAEQLSPDVILLDVRMPRLDGVEAARALSPRFPVLMLTYSDEPEIVRAALAAGARSYLIHGTFDTSVLGEAVRGTVYWQSHLSPGAATVLVDGARQLPPPRPGRDAFGLSEREGEIMHLMASGRANGQIASELFLAEKTVKNHINRVFARMGVTNRGEAIASWLGSRT